MTLAEIEALFLTISRITVIIMVIPILVGISQWKNLNKPLVIFWLFRLCIVILNLMEQAFIWLAIHDFERIRPFVERFEIENTNFWGVTYLLSNFFWLGWFFSLLVPNKKYRSWIKGIAAIGFIALIINYCFIEGMHAYGKFNTAATGIFTFGLAFFYLWHIYNSQLALPLTKNPYFWFSLALILPYLASFFLFLIGDVSHEQNLPLFLTMSIMKDGFIIIAQFFIAIGFYRARYAKYVPLPTYTKTRTN